MGAYREFGGPKRLRKVAVLGELLAVLAFSVNPRPAFLTTSLQRRAEQSLCTRQATGHALFCFGLSALTFADHTIDGTQRHQQRHHHSAKRNELAEQREFHASLRD